MKTNQIVRAWKDQNYRQNLTAAEQAELPEHPAGMIELADAELGVVSGGATTAEACNTLACSRLCLTHIGCTHQILCTSTCD